MSRILEDVGFVHLHVHSSYSLLEGALKIDDLKIELGYALLPLVNATNGSDRLTDQIKALRRGGHSAVGASQDALVYKMSDGTESLYVALNRGDGSQSAPGLPAGNYHDLVSDTDVSAPLTLPARSGMILQPK